MKFYAIGWRKRLAALLSLHFLLPVGFIPTTAVASGFVNDSTLKGSLYYWQRQRDRKEREPESVHFGQYQQNLHHSTVNAALDFSSGYAADVIGIDLAAFSALELFNGGPGAPNEIGFSDAKTRWEEHWTGDKNGASLYKAALKIKYHDLGLRGGKIQPEGQTLLAPHWSFLPGTYRGLETGYRLHFADDTALSFSYMWTDRYKAPWYEKMYNFRKADGITAIRYLHSIGFKYDFKNKLIFEGAFGQAKGYMDQYFSKVSYTVPFYGNDLRSSYQFYGAKDKEHGAVTNVNDIYDGLAWLQALTLGYTAGPFDFRLEGTWVKAEGNQGYFLQRMTPAYASSNGRLDIWWDSRSDWNADGEKALFAGVLYDLAGWQLPGLAVGASGAWGWGAKPSHYPAYDQNTRLKESAWNLDLLYTIQSGVARGTLFKLHYTRYDNHSDMPSYGGGYNNIFQDEKDVKFIVIAPFTLF